MLAYSNTGTGSKKSRPRDTTSKDKRGTATLFYLWTNWPSCNQLPRTQRASPHLLPQESFPARRSDYQPRYSYNQPRDNYRNSPQQHRRDLNLAALDEHSSNEDFIAELERNTSNRVSTDSQEPFHKNGKTMQNASVNIISSEAVMFSKQKSRNSENLHRRLTPHPPPLSGKRNQTCQYMKPTAKRETQPHLGHALGPARTQENNVENIRGEIESYVASALHLFEQLPSGPKPTGLPGTQPNEAQSSRVVVPHCTTPRLPRSPTESTTLSVHNRDKLPSFSAKNFEEFPSVVKQSFFPDPSKFTIKGQDSSPQPVQDVIDILNDNASRQYPSLEEHSTNVIPNSFCPVPVSSQSHSQSSPLQSSNNVVKESSQSKPRDLTVSAQLNGQSIKALVDTGAAISVKEVLQEVDKEQLLHSRLTT